MCSELGCICAIPEETAVKPCPPLLVFWQGVVKIGKWKRVSHSAQDMDMDEEMETKRVPSWTMT
jgi:hypothetical protein